MAIYRGEKILIVEDNFMSFKLAEVYFTKANLTVLHATDGLKALDIFKSDPDIDLILMDVQLPGMDGLQVTRHIRSVNKDIPIIAATANAFQEDEEACLKAGCNDYICKPIDFTLLFDKISKYLK